MDFKWFAKQASTRLAKVSERLNALLDELAGDVPEDLSHPNAMDALDPSVNASVIEFAEGLADHPNTFSMPLNTNQGWLTSCMQIVIDCSCWMHVQTDPDTFRLTRAQEWHARCVIKSCAMVMGSDLKASCR